MFSFCKVGSSQCLAIYWYWSFGRGLRVIFILILLLCGNFYASCFLTFGRSVGILWVVRFPSKIITKVLLRVTLNTITSCFYILYIMSFLFFPNKRNVIDGYVAGDADPFWSNWSHFRFVVQQPILHNLVGLF